LQGDPSAAPWAVDNTKEILGKKPLFGICMGHQIMGQAFGAKTFKLSFGHHGGNHPIRDMDTGKVQISAQNHNFAVDPNSLPKEVQVSHLNLNDGARQLTAGCLAARLLLPLCVFATAMLQR
jgi:carbamoyl-phosphate synthase small subunit